MAKDTYYFTHDYNARNDSKIKRLLLKHGYLGYGIFWAMIEDLYNNTNVLRLDYDSISFDLRCDKNLIKSIIEEFDLFVIEGEVFGSLSVQKRLEERNAKSVKARESVLKRWGKHTNVLPTNNDSNTIKEKKIKEKKIKEKKVKEINKDGVLIFPFESEEFKKKWGVLTSQKKWIGKSIDALQGNLDFLKAHTEPDALKIMQKTINGGWQGLFELKDNEKTKPVGTGTPSKTPSNDEL